MKFKVISGTSHSNTPGKTFVIYNVLLGEKHLIPDISHKFLQVLSYELGILRLLNSHVSVVCELVDE